MCIVLDQFVRNVRICLPFSFFSNTEDSCEMTRNTFSLGGVPDCAGLYTENFDNPSTNVVVADITAKVKCSPV